MRYKVTVPFIDDMGSISPFTVSESPMETKEEQALWEVNSMRDHDGLEHRKALPLGTRFEPIHEDN